MAEWDLWAKALGWESPQDIVTLLYPGAIYIGRREGQLQTQDLGNDQFPKREIRSDGLMEAEYSSARFIIVLEYQVKKDGEIGERLLGYSYEAKRLHGLPVAAWVIYLRPVFEPPQPPHTWAAPGLGRQLEYIYRSIELAEMPLEELEQKGLVGLAPLLLLTKGGATLEVFERAFTQLIPARKPEALGMLLWISGIVFKDMHVLQRVQRRFANMNEYLWENSWTYREWAKEQQQLGLEQGRVQGLEQGLKQGRVQGLEEGIEAGLRQSIETAVQTRFPRLLDLARERIEHIQDHAVLQRTLVAMIAVDTERNAQKFLLALNEGQ